jgi:RimJ/RimL family protein N-acetyltransferase
MQHIIAYEGLVHVSLGLMQEEYIDQYLPWPNRRIGVEGTLQRPPYSRNSGVEWVRSLDQKKGHDEVFAILVHTDDEKNPYRYVGHMGVHDIQWPDGRAKTGSIIGASEARSRGCGTEAKLLIQYHAFMILGIRKLTSSVKSFNGSSLGHLLKCGYQIVGRYKKHYFHEGAFGDEVLLECFREDWEPIWEQYQASKSLPSLTPEQKTLVTSETKK